MCLALLVEAGWKLARGASKENLSDRQLKVQKIPKEKASYKKVISKDRNLENKTI